METSRKIEFYPEHHSDENDLKLQVLPRKLVLMHIINRLLNLQTVWTAGHMRLLFSKTMTITVK